MGLPTLVNLALAQHGILPSDVEVVSSKVMPSPTSHHYEVKVKYEDAEGNLHSIRETYSLENLNEVA